MPAIKSRPVDAEDAALAARKRRFRAAQSMTVDGGIESSFVSRFGAIDERFWAPFYDACAAGPKWVAHRPLMISYSLPQTVNAKDTFGETMMTLAAIHGRTQVVTVLLGIKGDPWMFNNKGWSAVTAAAVYNHTALIKLFASQNVRLDMPDNRLGYTPAHFAVQVNNIDMLRLLYEHRANLAVAAKNGYTLLHTAAEAASEDCLEFLLAKRLVSVDARDTSHETPSHKAARHNHSRILEILCVHGSSLKTENLDQDCVADVYLDNMHVTRPMELK
ncbi:hypothetical protein H310_01248 [Aphanomyces invadans]|uniref:Uncharacterized protein n=1 Tax=Aphanomyces invadans TaxID=157072 RepID=A0A024UQZ6_9STRA|nr:hypothetical protein H310_01248 [Aphanomyces invadans]ETW08724.1 hypothetical protein H310_01248 [Aphanomyces invadans]|eukprot:XP_008862529.1 hypothetical protein H310_01248 [Aphanomyces invadans]